MIALQKKSRIVIFYWLPVLIWAGIIFHSSSQPYEKQDLRPGIGQYINEEKVEPLLEPIKFNYAGHEVSLETKGAAGMIEFFIRKGAHFGVYFILAFLLYRAFLAHAFIPRKSRWLTIIFAVSYAISDEIHQGFTSNRTPLPHDVGIDTIGVLIGVTTAFFFYQFIENKKQVR